MPLCCAESDPYQTLQEGLEIHAAAESLCSARTEFGGGGLHGAASATLTLGRAAAAGRSHPFHRHHHLRSEPVGVAMPPQFPCCNGATASTTSTGPGPTCVQPTIHVPSERTETAARHVDAALIFDECIYNCCSVPDQLEYSRV